MPIQIYCLQSNAKIKKISIIRYVNTRTQPKIK